MEQDSLFLSQRLFKLYSELLPLIRGLIGLNHTNSAVINLIDHHNPSFRSSQTSLLFTDFKLFWIWCPNLSLTKVDDYDLYALLYAGDEDDDEKDKITPEQAAQEAEKANGRVQSCDSNDVDYAEDTAEDGGESSESAAQAKSVPMNKNSMILVFGVVALIGVGAAGFFLMKKKKGGNKDSGSV